MSGAPAYRPVDFRKLRRDAVTAVPRPLAQWQDRMGVLAGEAWNRHLPSPVKWTRNRHEIATFAAVLEKLPDPGVGFVVSIGELQFPTFWAFSPKVALTLAAELIGNLEPDWPKPRSLSAVEESLIQLLINELCWALGEAWPGRQSIVCRPGAFEPRIARSRLFGRTDKMIVTEFQLATRLGDTECHWVIPQIPFEQMTCDEWPQTPVDEELKSTAPGIERAAVALPITMAVQLGTAQLPVSQLADLNVGDVVVLDQFISDPVLADIHGAAKYRGFPGRIGTQRSFQIVDFLDNASELANGAEG